MTAIFANSDGWTPNGPTPSHRLAPLTGRPNSTAKSPRPTAMRAVQITAGRR
jgi:hypothetical protein